MTQEGPVCCRGERRVAGWERRKKKNQLEDQVKQVHTRVADELGQASAGWTDAGVAEQKQDEGTVGGSRGAKRGKGDDVQGKEKSARRNVREYRKLRSVQGVSKP